jgi:hypothetical protein
VADSTSELLGTVAKAAVEAVGLTRPADPGPTEPVPVVKRKLPGVPQGDTNGLPQVVVSVGEEGATEYLTGTELLKSYPVTVALVTDTGSKAADDAVVRQWRERIEQELDKRSTWVSVPGWNETSLSNSHPFDRAALPKDANYTLVTAVVQMIEPLPGGGESEAESPLVWGQNYLVWG